MSAKPYADRLFQYHELGSLSTAAARAALISPAATHGVDYDEPAALSVVHESAGYPYFIQEYGLELWNHAETSPITSTDVEAVREIVTDSLARNFFGTRFQLATDAEQRYLAAMASLEPPPYRSSEDRQRLRRQRPARGVSIHTRRTHPKGTDRGAPHRGQLDFTVPLFAIAPRQPPQSPTSTTACDSTSTLCKTTALQIVICFDLIGITIPD